jgi:hypothetical protein
MGIAFKGRAADGQVVEQVGGTVRVGSREVFRGSKSKAPSLPLVDPPFIGKSTF